MWRLAQQRIPTLRAAAATRFAARRKPEEGTGGRRRQPLRDESPPRAPIRAAARRCQWVWGELVTDCRRLPRRLLRHRGPHLSRWLRRCGWRKFRTTAPAHRSTRFGSHQARRSFWVARCVKEAEAGSMAGALTTTFSQVGRYRSCLCPTTARRAASRVKITMHRIAPP